MPVINLLQNLGVLDVQLLVFLVFLVVVLTVPVRERSETCAVEDACSPRPEPGEDGTVESISTNADTQSLPLWQLQQ